MTARVIVVHWQDLYTRAESGTAAGSSASNVAPCAGVHPQPGYPTSSVARHSAMTRSWTRMYG